MKNEARLTSIPSASAVVLSPGFVGYELRQNTAMMRGETMQAISDTYVGYVTTIGLDRGMIHRNSVGSIARIASPGG